MHPTAQHRYTILPYKMADTYYCKFFSNIQYRKYSLTLSITVWFYIWYIDSRSERIWYPQVGMIPYLVSLLLRLPCREKALVLSSKQRHIFVVLKVVAWWSKPRTWPTKKRYYWQAIEGRYRTALAYSCDYSVERRLWSSQAVRDPVL